MNEPKTYEIRTIEDLADLVDLDNVERLAKDITGWLRGVACVKAITGPLEKEPAITLAWVDDGAHKIQITLNTTPDAQNP
jgi:hypothetical protein